MSRRYHNSPKRDFSPDRFQSLLDSIDDILLDLSSKRVQRMSHEEIVRSLSELDDEQWARIRDQRDSM